jgi:hypothetical protein
VVPLVPLARVVPLVPLARVVPLVPLARVAPLVPLARVVPLVPLARVAPAARAPRARGAGEAREARPKRSGGWRWASIENRRSGNFPERRNYERSLWALVTLRTAAAYALRSYAYAGCLVLVCDLVARCV